MCIIVNTGNTILFISEFFRPIKITYGIVMVNRF